MQQEFDGSDIVFAPGQYDNGFDTSNCTNFSIAFRNCKNLVYFPN